MTYQIQKIPLAKYPAIANLPIAKQEAITKQFGSPLQLTRTIELIRDATGNYKLDLPQAKKADELLMKLLEKKGFEVKPSPAPNPAPNPAPKPAPRPAPTPKPAPQKQHKYEVGFKFYNSGNIADECEIMSLNGHNEMGEPLYGVEFYDEGSGDWETVTIGEREIEGYVSDFGVPVNDDEPANNSPSASLKALLDDCALALEILEGAEKAAMQALFDDTELALSVL